MSNKNFKIKIPEFYIDAFLKKMKNSKKRSIEINNEFSEIELTMSEHRLMLAIFAIYTKLGYSDEIIKNGIRISRYRLYKEMRYPKSIGSSDKQLVKSALEKLSKRIFTICIKKYEKTLKDKRQFKYFTVYNKLFELSDENKLLHIKLNTIFIKKNYFRLIDSDIYLQLKELLKSDNRKVSKYHFNFLLWLLKQTKSTKPNEINIDKLSEILKFPQDDIAHKSQIIKKIRSMYEDFQNLGFISMFEIDQKAKSGSRKDIIHVKL